jgi:hypothetical protein
MAEGVVKFRRKPERSHNDDQLAARYTPGGPLGGLLKVAQESYPPNAELAEVQFAGGQQLLVVRYTETLENGPPKIKYVTVEAGHWLAYSPDSGFLYEATDGNWEQWYDRLE